jgi:hypothetical protein
MHYLYLIFFCACLVGCSHTEGISFSGIPDRLVDHKMKKKVWSMDAQEAALKLANDLKLDGDEVTLVKQIKPLDSGYVTYSGSFNGYSARDKLVRFGKNGVQYEVAFQSNHTGQTEYFYQKNRMFFSCKKGSLTEEMSKACEMIQYFEGMKMIFDSSFPIRQNYVCFNPPTFFNQVMIYDRKGLMGREIKGFENDWITLDNWASDFAEVVLKNANNLADSSGNKASNIESERTELLVLLREILHDETIPETFLSMVLEGVGMICLKELEEDLQQLSKRVPEAADYVKKYNQMESERNARGVWDTFKSKNKDDILYHKLSSRYYADKGQMLRTNLDLALKNLSAVGNEARISDLLDKGEDVGTLLYDMAFRDKAAFTRLSLKRLKKAKDSYEHYQYIKILQAAGQENALFDFLEKSDEAKFSLCSHVLADRIREKKPEWKLRLQSGLIRYIKNNEDPGLWTSTAMEDLMPKDDPDYFDLKVVGECLKDPKVKIMIKGNCYSLDEGRYDKLLKQWEGLAELE